MQTVGVNTLTPVFEVDADGTFTSFSVRQSSSPDDPTLRRHRIGIGLYDRTEQGRLIRRTSVETDIQGELTDVAKLVGVRQPDLVLLNDGDLTYAKIRLDERSMATVLKSIHTIDDSLARAVCWGAAWDMTRDAQLAAEDFVALVLRGLGEETDETAAKQLPIYVQITIDQYATDAQRPVLREAWERGLRQLIQTATPGSDHQLTFLKCFAGTLGKRIPPSSYGGAGRSPEAMAFMAGLLDGSERLPGLDVGPDLRWVLLTALAAGGHVGPEQVLAELAGDHTISGKERAAAALAVIPATETKQDAWRHAVLDERAANETQRSIAYVFDTSEQAEVVAPYLERYLAAAETIWEDRGVQIASTALEYMFPRCLTGEQTLDRVVSWLEGTRANPAATKYVREAAADIERALSCRAAGAAAEHARQAGEPPA
ncbi:MAG: ERAP1-like C-terminal domain-containing protein [Nocardioidaceae bacterium]